MRGTSHPWDVDQEKGLLPSLYGGSWLPKASASAGGFVWYFNYLYGPRSWQPEEIEPSMDENTLLRRLGDDEVTYDDGQYQRVHHSGGGPQGWAIDDELWAIDGADCSPCDNKVPDSH